MIQEQNDFKELEKALITLSGKIELIEELGKHKGDKFNIFSILKMERLEVHTHSAFIYELINPNGTHFQDNKYLEIFIAEVLNIKDFDYKNVKVGRETLTDTSRRIDFTIENKDCYIAIEMKIDATDQENQLSDYYKYSIKQNKEFSKVYYLTLDGRDSTENNFKEYEKISFQSNMLNFIDKSIEKSANLPIIRESLVQYKNLILKITKQTTEELQMESLKFINNPEMAKSATIMSKNLAYAWAERELLFWEKLEDKLRVYIEYKNGWKILQDKIFSNDYNENKNDSKEDVINKIVNIRNRGSEFVHFDFKKNDFYFRIYAYSSCNFSYLIFFENQKDISSISKKIGFKNRDGKLRYLRSNIKLNFSKDYDEPTYDIFDDKKLDEIVENIYNEIKSYMNILVVEELK